MTDQIQTQTDDEAPKSELDILKARAKVMGITFSNRIGVEALRAKIEAKMNDEDPPVDETDEVDDEQSSEVNDTTEQASETAETVETTEVIAQVVSAFVPPAPVEPTATIAQPISHAPTQAPVQAAPAPVAPVAAPVAEVAPAPAAKPVEKKLSKAEQLQALRTQMIADEMRLIRVRIACFNPQKSDLHGEIWTAGNDIIGTVRKYIPYGEATENGYHIPMILLRQLQEKRFLQIKTVRNQRTGTNEIKTSWAKEFNIEILPPLTTEELAKLAAQQAASGSIPQGLED